MEPIDLIKSHDDMNQAFASGDVFGAAQDVRERYLRTLASLPITNETMKHVEVIRALILNHLQMERTITELEKTITTLNAENGKVSGRVFWLTVAAVVFGSIQAFGVFWMVCHG